ncbi:MAG: FHA domain-containing protein [Anaerolineae bacterium]|nr:FHA domain-containing protein [Anaerolineae bacterium]
MATLDQLEIISVSGMVEFYELDPAKGVTSIGRHPDNDIVLNSPGVALFHAMLDHRQKPYHFLLLSHDDTTSLAGRLLPANTASPVQNWDNIQLDGYTLILVENSGPITSPGPATAPLPSRPTAPVRPPTGPLPTRPPSRPEEPPLGAYGAQAALPLPALASSTAQPVASLTTLPPDHADEIIIAELSGREWTINVDQSVTFQVNLINGGDIVANFVIGVEGLDENWVVVSPPYVNLNEGERVTVTIALSAPRVPSSRAGAHHFAVVVTSPNYPRRFSQRGATLVINPYYEFAVNELDPKQQTISWFQRSGHSRVTINNRGNSDTFFRLEGMNDERACSFEFQVPGETVGLAQQAELRLMPEETASIPVRITPYSRRLVGLRKRTYAYTITTTAISGQQTPRSLLGQLKTKPLLGPLPLALLGLLLVALIVYIFLPTIYLFSAEPQMVRAGEEVKLRWRGATFTNLRIDNGVGPLAGTVGEVIVAPKNTTIYKLSGDNWLSALLPSWFSASKEVTVEVEPVKPIIRVFSADKEGIINGEEVTLSWEVVDAEELVLRTNGNPETLLSTEHTSQRMAKPNVDTTYTLEARNIYGDVTDSLEVKVVIPTATPVPTPFVKKFIANPSVIIVGTPVIVEWDVEGADVVSVQPVGGNLPPIQSVSQSPQQNTTYVLNAAKGSSAIQPIAVQVFVTPAPTATPEPEAPEIEYFLVSDDDFVIGGEDELDAGNKVTLSWSVLGTVTDVQISNPDFGTVTDLLAKSTLDVTINDKRNFFVLTAFNGDKKASKTVQLTLETPTPTTTPEPTATPLPTPVPRPIISFFKADPSPNGGSPTDVTFKGGSPPTYEVVAGKDVQLSWDVRNADKVTLIGQGDQSAQGAKILPSVTANNTFQLKATNAGGDTDAFLRLEVKAPPPPPAPFDVNGQEGAGVNTISWKYDPNFKNSIEGFRIYSGDAPNQPLVDEFTLDRNASSWPHSGLSQTCGRGYFVTAVYIDVITKSRVEVPSTNSWFSSQCP